MVLIILCCNFSTQFLRVYIVMHQKQKENLRKFYKGKLCSLIKSGQVSRQDECLKS